MFRVKAHSLQAEHLHYVSHQIKKYVIDIWLICGNMKYILLRFLLRQKAHNTSNRKTFIMLAEHCESFKTFEETRRQK